MASPGRDSPGSEPPVAREVEPAFEGAPPLMRRLRSLIYETAAGLPAVGELTETLKWGEPSYAPARPRVGSSVRLGARADGSIAVLFICHTRLVDRFRQIYPDRFAFEGDRALVFAPGAPVPQAELGHCIAMALTYHLGQRAPKGRRG